MKKFLLGIGGIATAFSWAFFAQRAGGLTVVLPFVAPTALLAIGVAWIYFAFAGLKFPELSAIWSALVGGLTLSPLVAALFLGSGTSAGSAVVLLVSLAAGAALSGAVWQIRGNTIAAFREWRLNRGLAPHLQSSEWS